MGGGFPLFSGGRQKSNRSSLPAAFLPSLPAPMILGCLGVPERFSDGDLRMHRAPRVAKELEKYSSHHPAPAHPHRPGQMVLIPTFLSWGARTTLEAGGGGRRLPAAFHREVSSTLTTVSMLTGSHGFCNPRPVASLQELADEDLNAHLLPRKKEAA